MDLINTYKTFLDRGKTERECVSVALELADKAGFRDISTYESLRSGDKVYVVNKDKSVALFIIGRKSLQDGINFVTAHIDSPRLDLKMKPVYEKDGVVYLNTHYYGGIKKYQWVTMPLALHGVVFRKDGSSVNICIGEDEDGPSFCISDILPHMAQDQMKKGASEFIDGENLDIVAGLNLNEGDEKDGGKKEILRIIEKEYKINEEDFLSAEIEVVPAGRARSLGFDSSMVMAYGQDDRVCAYTALQAVLDSDSDLETTACTLLVDKEEIGSVGATGMDSELLPNMVSEIMDKAGEYSSLALRRCLKNSHMLSSDVTAAFDPLNGELYDKMNASFMSKGVSFEKYTGSRGKSGSSDACPEFIAKLRKTLDNAGVKYQMNEMSKVDVGGGGTIAKFAAYYGMDVIDCGVCVLSMHSPWEITAVKDIESAYSAYKAFFAD